MDYIFINAYTNFNLGDDLFVKILCERYPQNRFILFAPKRYKITFKNNNNLIILPQDNLVVRTVNFLSRKTNMRKFSFQNLISNRCKAVVHIGGSIFMEDEGWRKRLKRKQELRKLKQPYFVLGSNFGPYKDKSYLENHKEIFKSYTDICFREKYSYSLFEDLENVRWADDVVFQLESNNSNVEYLNIAISVIKPSFRKNLRGYDDIYYTKIKEIAMYFMDKGYQVTLMSFCEKEGDREAIDEIVGLLPSKYKDEVIKHYYQTNMNASLKVIENSDFVIATRFHSMILGWVYEKPVFPIVYSNKMYNVMEGTKFTGKSTNFVDIASLAASEVYETMNTNLVDVSQQIKNSENQFKQLDSYLLK